MKTCTVLDLPIDERPRERLIKYGAESLSLQELLSLIFGRGVKGESVINISQKLISNFGSLNKIYEASITQLQKIKGLGQAKACQLKACFETGNRFGKESLLNKHQKKIIRTPEDIYPLLKEKIINFNREYFLAASLDNRNKIISIDIISIGTLNSSLIHPRETFEAAIKNHAAGIILCHNHPSGELIPSKDDLAITKNLIGAGKLLQIEIIDHLIIDKVQWSSMKEGNFF